MVADWHDGFVLRSEWIPGEGQAGAYRLTLANHSGAAIRGFRLGISGPARINEEARLSHGHVVTQLSNYAELAPPADFTLIAGGEWTVEIDRLDYPLRHWTDGATTGFVILADGKAIPAVTFPTDRADSAAYRRGTMQLEGTPSALSIVPWPNKVAVSGSRSAPHGLAIAPGDSPAAGAAFRELTDRLFPGEGLVREAHEDGLKVMLSKDDGLGAEAYRLVFSSQGAKVEAASDAGFLYGLVTLGQMARGARHKRQDHIFPAAGSIEDAPAMGFRGCHLDVARRFYGVAEIEKFSLSSPGTSSTASTGI